jgi:hypothetical protein
MRLRRLLGSQESLGRDALGAWGFWPIRCHSGVYIVSLRPVQPRGPHNLNCDSKCWGRIWPPRRARARGQFAAVHRDRSIRTGALLSYSADRGPFLDDQVQWPTATAYGRPQCGCPGGPGLCKGRFGADRLAGGRPELRHTAVQSTFIPMRSPNRFMMAAASTAQGGVWGPGKQSGVEGGQRS